MPASVVLRELEWAALQSSPVMQQEEYAHVRKGKEAWGRVLHRLQRKCYTRAQGAYISPSLSLTHNNKSTRLFLCVAPWFTRSERKDRHSSRENVYRFALGLLSTALIASLVSLPSNTLA